MEVKCNSIPCLFLIHITLKMMTEILIHELYKHGHTYVGGPKNNRNLNVAHKLKVVS